MNKYAPTILLLAGCFSAAVSARPIYITPMLGYAWGGEIETPEDNNYDVEGDINFNLAVDTDLMNGRAGLFFAQQDSEVETIGVDTTFRYLHFQSASYFRIQPKVNTYLGLSVGGTQIDVDGADDEYEFSLGAFLGLEYQITPSWMLQGQLRFLGTLVEGDSITYCQSGSSGQSCKFFFKSDWISQGQANLGLTYRF